MILSMMAMVLAMAQDAPQPAAADGEPPRRVRSVLVYGDDPCPKAEGDEIVVCPRMDESERYRIPKAFRDPPDESSSASWSRRVDLVNEVNRVGMPGSCSAVGTGGQTGCNSSFIRLWRDDQEAQRRAAEQAGEKLED